jgi:hypothetical protein
MRCSLAKLPGFSGLAQVCFGSVVSASTGNEVRVKIMNEKINLLVSGRIMLSMCKYLIILNIL